jgi:hypothetical protein
MPRKTFAAVLPLLTVLALTMPGKASAGPPEVVPGKMKLDEVAEGLKKYRWGTDTQKRIRWLQKLAPTHDPRVAVALWNAINSPQIDLTYNSSQTAAKLLALHFGGKDEEDLDLLMIIDGEEPKKAAIEWWHENEADLRRRAKQLPQ